MLFSTTRSRRYLRLLMPAVFGTHRTKQILTANPTVDNLRKDATNVHICVYDYNAETMVEQDLKSVEESFPFRGNKRVSWINIDGVRKSDVESARRRRGLASSLVTRPTRRRQRRYRLSQVRFLRG